MSDVIPSTRWLRAKIGRVGAGEEGICNCKVVGHAAPYRAEVVDANTGQVISAYLCLNRAAGWADRHGLKFPPLKWDEQSEALINDAQRL